MKVAIIGTGCQGEQYARRLIDKLGEENVIVVSDVSEINESDFDHILIVDSQITTPTMQLKPICGMYENQFEPKQKHCKKGYERKYKFHK